MMKKNIILILAGVTAIITACGNKDWVDTNYTYTHAIIRLRNGKVIEGQLQSWRDYEDGDQIQVKIDGNTYLVHSSNVDLINESN